jgi:hypothetical protein
MIGRARIVVTSGALALVALSAWSFTDKPPLVSTGFPSSMLTWLKAETEDLSPRIIDSRIDWVCVIPAYQTLGDGLSDLGIVEDLPLYIPDGTFAMVLTFEDETLESAMIDFMTYDVMTSENRCHSADHILSIRAEAGTRSRELLFRLPTGSTE